MKNIRTIDLDQFNRALLRLQNLSGEVSHFKVNPIIQDFITSVLPDEGKEACPSPEDSLKEDASNSRGAQSQTLPDC